MALTQFFHTSEQTAPSCEELYEKYGAMLYRICFSIMRQSSDAADAVQDVFVKYISKKPHFESDEHQKAWFIRVATNCCKDELRKKAIRHAVSLDDVHDNESEEKDSIMEEIMSLPLKYREIIVLYYFEDIDISQAAQALGLSVSAAKMRLSRGRQMLKEILEK